MSVDREKLYSGVPFSPAVRVPLVERPSARAERPVAPRGGNAAEAAAADAAPVGRRVASPDDTLLSQPNDDI